MALLRIHPGFNLVKTEQDINQLFNELALRSSRRLQDSVWTPVSDILETKDGWQLRLDLPGVSPDEIKIKVQEGKLEISGERHVSKGDETLTVHRSECPSGTFYRSFNLPENCQTEEIKAENRLGQLILHLPKSEETKPKEISITVK